MKRYWWIPLLAAALGTALHFFYDWFPNPLVGVIAPVGESVWEHLKLLYWPWLAACLLSRSRHPNFWAGACAALLAMPPLLLGIYYTLGCGFSLSGLALDIALYYLTISFGYLILCLGLRHPGAGRLAGVMCMLAGLWGASLLILSMAPLDRPIFR